MYVMRAATKKITLNVPVDILENATRITGHGITATIVEGLREIEKRAQRSAPRKRSRRWRQAKLRWVTVAGGLPEGLGIADRAAMHDWLTKDWTIMT